MSAVRVPARLTVDQLMAAIKRLSPAEQQELQRQFIEWRLQNGVPEESEAALLAYIQENSRLPAAEQRRFDHLRRKQQAEVLTEAQEADLQELWRRVEQMNVSRLEALTRLARQRNTDVKTLMRELGTSEEPGVF